MYDVTNGESFANVKRWLHEIDQNCEVVNKILGEFFLLSLNQPWCFPFLSITSDPKSVNIGSNFVYYALYLRRIPNVVY